MKCFLPVLMLITGFTTTSWADSEVDVPDDPGDTAQLHFDAETDIDTAASPYGDRRHLGRRIRSEVLDAVVQAIEDNPDISDEDKRITTRALRDRSRFRGLNIDGGLNAKTTLIATLSILLIFGTPIMLVAAILYAGHRKRRLASDTASQFLANGQTVPPEVWQGLAGDASPRSNLHKGMIMLGAGLGIFLCFWLIGSMKAAYLGLIPLFIGIAQLLIWKLENNKETPGE